MSGSSAGFPRVYDIVLELISHVDAQIDAGPLSAFVAAYQSRGAVPEEPARRDSWHFGIAAHKVAIHDRMRTPRALSAFALPGYRATWRWHRSPRSPPWPCTRRPPPER